MNRMLRACRWSGVFSFLLLSIGLNSARAQSTAGYGDWQLHLPTNQANALADAGNRVYVATEDAFFFFDKELNTTQLLSKRDGLHDVGISTIGYDPTTKQVLVAYRSANLDLLAADGSIINIADIARKPITGGKTISHISFSKGKAYLSCSFGIIVVDMARHEILDTYGNIGPGGVPVTVFTTTVLDNTLFATTSAGVMRGQLTDNLLDYRRWSIDLPASASNSYRPLTVQGRNVYTARDGGAVLCYNCGATPWQPVSNTYAVGYRYLAAASNGLLIIGDDKTTLRRTDGSTTRLLNSTQSPYPRAILQSSEGAYYIADAQNGLIKTTDGQQSENFVSNAPATSRAFSVLADARTNTVDVFGGGYFDRYVQQGSLSGFFEYKDGKWTNFTNETFRPTPTFSKFKDITRGVRTKDGTLYIATYGNGLLQWKAPWEFQQFTQGIPSNPLKSAIPADPNYTRITDLAVSSTDNVWVVNRHQLSGTSGLHEYTPATNTWQTMPYFSGFENLDRIVLDANDYVWASQARLGGIGLLAYDPASQSIRYFNVGNSGLPANEIYDIAKDRKGDIWVATAKGIAVFVDPSSVFLPDGAGNFQQPFIRRGITTGYRALLNEFVKTVAVDGANRKWFGTDRGLWLFSEDADESLQHFTTDNSPLPSNNIVDVEVNDRTGEVFVITDGGVVTYRGDASVTEGKPDCAKVSPNPVRTNFTGQVGISGLANNGIVKITDVTGKLVYQTRANGGTVIWTLADYNGRKVQSGVYLVLSSDADGKNGCVSKIAVVEK